MKIILSFFIFISLFFNLHAQAKDSINIQVKDSVQVRDTLIQRADSLKDSLQVKKREPILPIYKLSLVPSSEYQSIITNNDILHDIYRNTGNLLSDYSLGFERNLGITGQPNEVLIYGAGFNQVSYLRNGTLINNRLTNSFDLNNIQSEIIDSIEIVPSTRGFLYGNFNNNASVNFIAKYRFVPDSTRSPYSRVKFYQAPNEEAMIDFIYNSNFSRRLNVTLSLTNTTSNLRFIQTNNGNIDAFGSWLGTARFRYYLSNKYNIIGSYRYKKSNARLFGGINVDSTLARQETDNLNAIYSDNNQITNYIDRYQKITGHEFEIELIGNTLENLKSEYKFYYSFDQTEFRQNETRKEKTPFIFDNNKYNLYGGLVRQSFENNFVGLDASAGYEVTDYKADVIKEIDKVNSLFLSGRIYLNLLNKSVVPSLFVKYLDYNKRSLTGFGADVSVNFIPRTQLYAGVSHYKRPLNIIENNYYKTIEYRSIPDLKQTTAVEIGSKFNNNSLSTNLSLFYRQTKNDVIPKVDANSLTRFVERDSKIYGAGLKADFDFWKIAIETNSAYYSIKSNDNRYFSLPELTSSSGIYYKDILFNSNLELKTGIRTRFTGWQYSTAYDFERNLTGLREAGFGEWEGIDQFNYKVPASFTMDFQLIGRIRKSAIIYLMVENILGKDYYIVPFYPMYQRGLTFGISWEFLN